MIRAIFGLRADKRGVSALEYGLLAALVAVAIIGGVSALGNSLGGLFKTVSNQINTANTSATTTTTTSR